ncbi:MAG: Hsp70 family protein, partial [Anaerolineae bacterium]
AADNNSLGRFILDGFPPAPRGVPQIEVTFDIDADGILHVSARDKATGREQRITITASSGLTESEIKRMVREAEQFAEEDRRRKEEVEARNNADSIIYQAEKLLREYGDKVPADLRADVERKIESTRSAMQGRDVARIRQATQELGEALQRLGAAMYQAAGPSAAGGTHDGPTSGGGEEEVVDGEYRQA